MPQQWGPHSLHRSFRRATASTARPRRGGARLAYRDPSGERWQDPSTPEQWGPPSLHRSFRRAIASSVHAAAVESAYLQRVNVTTGYALVKTRHSRVPTYLQRETDRADWSTPTFTLPCPKNDGVYGIPCHVYFSPELYPNFPKCTLTWREV